MPRSYFRKVITTLLIAAWAQTLLNTTFNLFAQDQGSIQLATGSALDSVLPRDFYLEGQAIPTEKWNAVLLRTPAGTRALLALIATSGYSSQVQQKYLGMLITEGTLSVCGAALPVGSYGFGLQKPALSLAAERAASEKFVLYNQAGQAILSCAAERDEKIKRPVPLEVIVNHGNGARLYLGRYWIKMETRAIPQGQ